MVEEVRPASLEATAHWTPGPWGPCRVAFEMPATPTPCKKQQCGAVSRAKSILFMQFPLGCGYETEYFLFISQI